MTKEQYACIKTARHSAKVCNKACDVTCGKPAIKPYVRDAVRTVMHALYLCSNTCIIPVKIDEIRHVVMPALGHAVWHV